jgi:H+/gluconate symporter-like permease
MEQLTLINVIIMILGVTLNILFKLRRVLDKGTPDKFSLKFWIKDNWIVLSITVIGAITSLLMADDLIKMLGVTAEDGAPFFKIHAFLSGFVPHVMIDRMKKFIPLKENK